MRQAVDVPARMTMVVAALCILAASLPSAPARAQQNDTCRDLRTVARIGPTTADSREPFRTTRDVFRVTYEVDFENDSQNNFKDFTVDITDRFGLVESDSRDTDGGQSFLVPEDAGTYAIETDVEPENGARYTVVVEECAEDGGNGGGEGGGGPSDGQYDNEDGGGGDGDVELDCASFDSQAEAQANLDANPSDPNNLDADDDGEACEVFDYGDGGADDGDVDDPDDVVPGTAADEDLPDTGGLPLPATLLAFALLVTSVALLGASIRREL